MKKKSKLFAYRCWSADFIAAKNQEIKYSNLFTEHIIALFKFVSIDLILWHTQLIVCAVKCYHGLYHGLFISLFKLIPCPIHWIVYVLANSNFLFEFYSSFSTAQTHKSIIFIWIVWSTLYVYLWLLIQPWLYTISGSLQRKIKENCNSWQIDISHHSFP